MISLINLSALTETKETSSFIPQTIGQVIPDIKIQWLSFEAFLALCDRYAPKPSYCCEPFTSVYNLGWLVKTYMSNNVIPKYKRGESDTDEFISHLFVGFSFLETVNFLDTKPDIVDRIWGNRERFISLWGLASKEDLTNKHIAKSLLEQAWTARMCFSERSAEKVNHFFQAQQGNSVIIIANSNPLDVFHSMRHLKEVYPHLKWVDDEALWDRIKRPNKPLAKGIHLTIDGALKLYVSYAHRAFKTGIEHETGMRTDNLIEKLMTEEELTHEEITLISQWPKDLEMGQSLGIANCVNAQVYFNAQNFSRKIQ